MHTSKNTLPPNRHQSAFATFVTLIPLVYYIPPWLMKNVSTNQLTVTVLAVAIIVPIISYVALPVFFQLVKILREKN